MSHARPKILLIRLRSANWIGAVEVFNAFLVIMRLPFTAKSVAAKTIAQMVGGADYFVVGNRSADLWLWHL